MNKKSKGVASPIVTRYNNIIIGSDYNMNESSISRLHRKIGNGNVGMISASRSDLTNRENSLRSSALQSSLLSSGFDVTRITGNYIEQYGTDEAVEVKETSFFVAENDETVGKLLDALIAEAEKYDQDSIFYKPKDEKGYLLGTSTRSNAFPPKGEKVEVGEPVFGKEGEFFSRVKNRPFTFETIEEVSRPSGFFGRWGESLAKK